MKRRNFLQNLGLGTGSVLISKNLNARNLTPYTPLNYEVSSINDLISKEGMVMIRLNYSSTSPSVMKQHRGKFSVSPGKIHDIRSYFFHGQHDDIDIAVPEMDIQSYPGNQDVVVLWIAEALKNTSIKFPLGTKNESVTISDIINEKDIELVNDEAKVTISYLLDKEIGEVALSEAGIAQQGNTFTFTAMADPQGGNPYAHETVATRMRVHNAFIDESVRLVNEISPKPAFNIVIGDIVDGQGHHADFRAMNDMLFNVKAPTIYELGNHETRYRSTFSPGYDMSAFDNYFAAQKEFNGMDKLLYSFNLGKWHFVVWPDPLRSNFWETHPHYFRWLEKDLEKHKDRPTMLFQHVPVHPIGILPLINYAESVDVKRTLIDILATHGNVKYVLSGHVHIPMKSSVKTSVTHRGIKFINLPAAGYRPRAFGEEDFNGGPSQGIAIVDIDGDKASIRYRAVTNEEFTYPEPPEFDSNKYPLWLNHKWELAEDDKLNNGDFSNGLNNWHKRYVYTEDVHPSNICEIRKDDQNKPYLYLFNRSRGYNAPGQDRLPQSINRVCQVVRQIPGKIPFIDLEYMIDHKFFLPENHAGAYIWIEGFEKGLKRLNVVYSNSYVHWQLGGNQSQLRTVIPVHLDISTEPGNWKKLKLNPCVDFVNFTDDKEYRLQHIDTVAINFGVWTLNEGYKKFAAAGFRDIRLEFMDINDLFGSKSTNDGMPVPKKEQKYLWWHGISHPSGEHQSIAEDLNKYL